MEMQFANTAIRIGNIICRDAIRYNNRCNWVGADSDISSSGSRPYMAAMKSSWYGGTAGVAWFLAHLSEISGEKMHKTIALEAIEQSLENYSKMEFGKLGFHSGVSGVAFSAIEIGQKLQRNDLVERGIQLLCSLLELPESDYTLDVIDGCAGAIPAILRVQRDFPEPALEQLLSKMGDHLLLQAQAEQRGISWQTMPYGASANLTGYAHGAAGIASALLELWRHTNDERYKKAAYAGFAYEDACFDQQQENWPDFREDDRQAKPDPAAPKACGCAWCHGAPGIGLSRIRAYQLSGDTAFLPAAQTAVKTTARYFGVKTLGNYSLCHGIFGNADLLIEAAQTFQDNSLLQKVEAVAEEASAPFLNKNSTLANGAQTELSSYDMMLGLSGIGYGFLRVADPVHNGSILLLH